MFQHLVSSDGNRLAYRHRAGAAPTIVFLPGYMSDMTGSKAEALDLWAAARGQGFLRLDYSGCGASGGRFEDGTLDRWQRDARAVIDHAAPGPVLLVGSSMGGWLALLLARDLGIRCAALVGIAAAPDFTEWGTSAADRQRFEAGETITEPSAYADTPYITTAAFWRSGQANRLLGGPIAYDGPVRLLHGQGDPDVPWPIALDIADRVSSSDVQVTLVKDGDHRLSRPQDIALLTATLDDVLETL